MAHGIYVRSEEFRKSRSIAMTGKPHPHIGTPRPNNGRHPRSAETKEKIRVAMTGRKVSQETGRKISAAKKGHIVTDVTRAKLRIANLGKKMSPKTREKMRLSRSGDKSRLWKGGITPAIRSIRECAKYEEWRKQVFQRDDFICRECNMRGGYLHAHHIKSFSDIISEIMANLPAMGLYAAALVYSPLWDTSNGVTLCEKCHKERHR